MKVLLTGANGFIGRHLVAHLNKRGIDFMTLGRTPLNDCFNVSSDLLSDLNLAQKLHVIQPSHLIHLAWYTEHGRYWNSDLNLAWVEATNRLARAFGEYGGKHLTIAGTCAEYDWNYGYCVEDVTPLKPTTLYGCSKNLARQSVNRICAEYGVSTAWARIFYPYGAGESSKRLIPSLFRVYKNREEPFKVYAEAYRDLLHVSDVASALVACCESETQGVINISSGKATSLAAVVRTVAEICGEKPRIHHRRSSEVINEPRLLIGDNKKLKSTGWAQKINLITGLTEYHQDKK